MLQETKQAAERFLQELRQYTVSNTVTEDVSRIHASLKHSVKKVVRNDSIQERLDYKKLRAFRKSVKASQTSGFSNVAYESAFFVTSPFRAFIQDYLDLYDYDRVQRLYVDYISNRTYLMSPTAEGANKQIENITLAQINFVTQKVAGIIQFTQELERYTDFEDYILQQVAIDLESKIHYYIVNSLNGVASTPSYPGAGGFTNVSNLYSLAQFLYYALRIENTKERCSSAIVLYPYSRFNSLSALYSPQTLLPASDEISSYFEENMRRLTIIPHDIFDITSLQDGFLALNKCNVIVSVSEVIIKQAPLLGVTSHPTLGNIALERNIISLVYEAFVNFAYVPQRTITVGSTTLTIPAVLRDSITTGLNSI